MLNQQVEEFSKIRFHKIVSSHNFSKFINFYGFHFITGKYYERLMLSLNAITISAGCFPKEENSGGKHG